jgi:predicted RNA-binding protein (TIGR00451 family)
VLVHLDKELLATLRPTNGFFSLSVAGARRLASILKPPRLRVVVQEDVEEFIAKGRNVFARHVVAADPEIRPREEVIVTSRGDEVLAVGRALLTGEEMLAFKRGVAVKIRRGIDEG